MREFRVRGCLLFEKNRGARGERGGLFEPLNLAAVAAPAAVPLF